MADLASRGKSGGVFERRVITFVSCGATDGRNDPHGASHDFLQQALTIFQVMGGVARIEAPGIAAARFGSVEMSETDAERAVLAALELQSALQANPRFQRLALRIGVSTGLVWTKPGETGNDTENGYFANAAAMQASCLRELAVPGALLITETTKDFVKELFEYSEGAPVLLRNFSEPIRAYRVARPSGVENRFEALRSQRLRLFGRERELHRLAALWSAARSNHGHAVLITGPQGIGKSRLVNEFDRNTLGVPGARIRLFGSPHHQNTVLYPLMRFLERVCGFTRFDTPSAKAVKLRELLSLLDIRSSQDLSLIGSLLGHGEDDAGLKSMNPRRYRELLLDALVRLLHAQARQGPVLMVFEDLHWADPTTRDFMALVVRSIRDLPMLLLVTSRTEAAQAWGEGSPTSHMTLGPLTPSETAAFVSVISKKPAMTAALSEHIVNCTGGVPLFVEELTKVLLETGIPLVSGGRDALNLRQLLQNLPVSIHAALLARLDRLDEGKAVACVASVLGRRFSHRLLEGAANMGSEQLNRGLARLIDAGLILRKGSPPEADYLFKHALVQEVAYSTLAPAAKKALHRTCAQLLQTDQGDGLVRGPEAIAHHLSEAGEADDAAAYWFAAGTQAIARSANPEVIEHLRAGLKALRKVPPSLDRDNRERRMLMALGPATMAVHGYGSTEGRNVFERAAELVAETTPVPERLHILCGLWNVRSGRSELHSALQLAEQFYDLANMAGAGLNLANCVMGQTLAAMGEFKRAHSHFLYVIGQYRDKDAGDGVHFAADEHILALSYIGRVLWSLGYVDQAAAATEEAVARARNGADAISTAVAFVGRLFMATHRGDVKTAMETVGEAEAHCAHYGLHLIEHWMTFNRGALLVRQNNVGQGIELMRLAVAAADERQTRQFRTFQLYCIAEAECKLGSFHQALATVDGALALSEHSGERWSAAALHRLRGEIFMELGRPCEGRREFALGLKLAERQAARLEELRLALAVMRYATTDVEKRSAAQQLSAVYAWFEEGHGLPDLKEAHDQLSELGLLRR